MTRARTPSQLDGRSPRHAFDDDPAHLAKCEKCTAEANRPARPEVLRLINETPMPAHTLGQLVTEDGLHAGWIVATETPLRATVQEGMLLLGHARVEMLKQFEGKQVVILEVKA